MKKTIALPNQKITYQVRKSKRAKRLRIAVYCDTSVVMTVPMGFNLDKAEMYLKKKVDWILDQIEFFKKFRNFGWTKTDHKHYLKHKEQALELIKKKVDYWNKIFNFSYNIINIKKQKTRWGSCSKKRNLNFNYKVVFLPDEQVDYLVVHELCHLKEFNHSKRFWQLVERAIPDHRKLKKALIYSF